MIKHIFALFFALAACSTGYCSTIELANGYKLEGEIVGRSETTLNVMSPTMGRIDVPMSNVAKIEEKVQTADATPAPAAAPAPVAAAPAPAPVEDRGIWGIFDPWKTEFGLGVGLLSGKQDSESTSVTFSTERKWTEQELRFDLLQQYEQTTDKSGADNVTQDMFKAIARYRHDISERLFLQSETQYSFDNTKNIDEDIRESIGLGWRIIKRERIELSLTPSMTVQHQVVNGDTLDLTYAPSIFEEFIFMWTERVSIRQEASALFPVNGDNDATYHFGLTLKNQLSGHLSLNLMYLYDYDGAYLVLDDDREQHTLKLMLGVTF